MGRRVFGVDAQARATMSGEQMRVLVEVLDADEAGRHQEVAALLAARAIAGVARVGGAVAGARARRFGHGTLAFGGRASMYLAEGGQLGQIELVPLAHDPPGAAHAAALKAFAERLTEMAHHAGEVFAAAALDGRGVDLQEAPLEVDDRAVAFVDGLGG